MNVNRTMIGAAMIASTVATASLADERTQRDIDATAIARVCLSEAGWDITDDCAGIVSVLRNRQTALRMRTISGTAAAYSTRAFAKDRVGRRAWIPWVADTDDAPPHWPSNVSWPVHRDKWNALVEHAHELLDRPSLCADAHHWGGAMDTWRAERAGWSQVPCGNTRNLFWDGVRR
jgi:hypothetical protein